MTDAVPVGPGSGEGWPLALQLQRGTASVELLLLICRCPECGKLLPPIYNTDGDGSGWTRGWLVICADCLRQIRSALVEAAS